MGEQQIKEAKTRNIDSTREARHNVLKSGQKEGIATKLGREIVYTRKREKERNDKTEGKRKGMSKRRTNEQGAKRIYGE